GDDIRRSLQFFDEAGEAIHKVHLRPASNLYAYQKLVGELSSPDQSQSVDVKGIAGSQSEAGEAGSAEDLRVRWSRMTDVHQFFGMLKTLKLSRHQAVRMIGDDYAWKLADESLTAMFSHAASGAMPIMCFVGNRGCVQIHSGPMANI